MYYIYTVKDTIRITPEYFNEDPIKAATEILQKKYERVLDKDLGVLLAVYNVRDISEGEILPEDPAIYHTVTFDVLTFNLEIEEVVVGEVSELAEFGCFVRIGPMDGLVHISQIADEFMTFDRKANMFISKSTKRMLKKGDIVYAKVSTISMKNNIKESKIALTMRPEGLGKPEWQFEKKETQKKQGQKRR
ncbi:MAG: DNA-directed RNA polymerase [Candidatus Micrarchaeaceae archaeon]